MRKWCVHLLVAICMVAAPVCRAEGPGPALPNAAPESTPHTSELPGTGSLEKFIEIQEFLEASKDPDWLMTIGGVALALFAVQRLIRLVIGDLPNQAIPAFVRLRRVNRTLLQGQRTEQQLMELIPRVLEAGKTAKESAETLRRHFREVPPKIPYRHRIRNGTLTEMDVMLEDPQLRKELENHPRARKWLHRYLELKTDYTAQMTELVELYNRGADALRAFSDRTNSLAEGVFMADSLRHKPTEFRARVAHEKPPGELHLSLNSGFTREITDPSALARELHTPATTCKELYSKLHLERTRSRMTLLRQGVLRPAAELALIGTGLGAYWWGAGRIRDRHNADPGQLVEQARAREQLQAVQTANRMQELSSLIETLQKARTEGADKAKVQKIYGVLRTVLRAHMDSIAEDLRFHTSWEARAAAGFNEALQKFKTDDAFANNVIDAALAEAASSELKATDMKGLQEVLTPAEPSSTPLRERLLMKSFAFSAKYLWPRLTIEGNAQPVQASTVANVVNDAIPLLNELSAPPPKKEPESPSGEPSAAVPREPRPDPEKGLAKLAPEEVPLIPAAAK